MRGVYSTVADTRRCEKHDTVSQRSPRIAVIEDRGLCLRSWPSKRQSSTGVQSTVSGKNTLPAEQSIGMSMGLWKGQPDHQSHRQLWTNRGDASERSIIRSERLG